MVQLHTPTQDLDRRVYLNSVTQQRPGHSRSWECPGLLLRAGVPQCSALTSLYPSPSDSGT